MSIAIKFGELSDPKQLSGLIYLDAVTSYDKNFKGRVTEHPIETGVSISDHFRSDNPTFKISGVISSVDLSPIPYMTSIGGQRPLNANYPAIPIVVSDLLSAVARWVPEGARQMGQWFGENVSGMSPVRNNYRKDVETLIETIMNGVYFNQDRGRWENRITLSTIYEMEDNRVDKSYDNCVLTDYKVSEDPETGDALYLEMSFEQVRFATSESVDTPAPVPNSPTGRGASTSKSRGGVSTKDTTASSGALEPLERSKPTSTEIFGWL